jgi:hypothetical protein
MIHHKGPRCGDRGDDSGWWRTLLGHNVLSQWRHRSVGSRLLDHECRYLRLQGRNLNRGRQRVQRNLWSGDRTDRGRFRELGDLLSERKAWMKDDRVKLEYRSCLRADAYACRRTERCRKVDIAGDGGGCWTRKRKLRVRTSGASASRSLRRLIEFLGRC